MKIAISIAMFFIIALASFHALAAEADNYCLNGSPPPTFVPCTGRQPLVVSGSVYQLTPLGCQQITSLSAAAGFASVPTGATLASLSVEGEPVRYRDDGTNPTASVGLLLPAGGPWPYQGSLSAIKFIQTTASATIDVCFYE